MYADPLIGLELANFRIEHLIGRGGMAQVYYGVDVKLQRPVAIKVLDARCRDDLAYAERFVREAQTVATWRHENILQVYYADEQEGLYYFAMEHIDGPDLGKLMSHYTQAGKRMPHDEVVRVGRAIAGALDYAHRKGVIHRDVKPSNVMIASDGRVVLADFGLALDTRQGTLGEVFGSAHYAAPEQVHDSSKAVPQSDLYSLGIILYEMLTGVVPFDDPSPISVALQHATAPPPSPRLINPSLNTETEAVLTKALQKSPSGRYQSGVELIDALEKALLAEPVVPAEQEDVSLPPEPSPVGGLVKRRGIWISVGCLFAGLAILISGVVLLLSNKPSREVLSSPVLAEQPSPGYTMYLPAVSSEKRPDFESPLLPPPLPSLTVSPSTGQRFVIYYNENSLYLLNDSDSDRQVRPLAFERLDDSGASLNRFEGSVWAEYYPVARPGRCMRIEISRSSPYLHPSQCNGHYDSSISYSRNNKSIFWTPQEGSRQFRVLWGQKEIARCEIAAGVCEVFLP